MKPDFKENFLENTLTINEKAELDTLEGIIGREMGSFMAVGNALLTIRNSKLYREEFKTFEDYCRGRWGVSRAYANCVIGASTVADNLATCVAKPTNEYQLRPLVSLEPAQQRTVWEEAVKTAPAGKAVTYTQVKALVTELIGPAPSPPTKKKDPYAHSDANYFVSLAIINLGRIRDDDPLRVEAVGRISEWIQEKLTIWT